MMKNSNITTTDFDEFYDRNEPDSAGALAALYRSVSQGADEDFFQTKEVVQGNVTHHVVASSGDVLILTAKSHAAFLKFIESKNEDTELGIEEAAGYEYAMNNPRS